VWCSEKQTLPYDSSLNTNSVARVGYCTDKL